MQVAQLKAKAGMGWVVEGFRLLRAAPIPILVITMTYLLLLVIMMTLPRIGAFAPLVLTPVLSVGLMHAVRAIDQKRPATPVMLFHGFKDRARAAWKPLLLIGLINAASTVLALGISAAIDGGVVLEIATGTFDDTDPRLQDASVLWSVITFLLVYTPMQMALWYAPLFVAWHGLPPGKALFYSLMAVIRNKWAFAQYLMAWMAVALVASIIVQILNSLLKGTPSLLSMLMMPISLIMLSAFYCSFWPSYRDAVSDDAPPSAAAPTP